jgi:NADH-quinone oxidoreductase subunit G
MTFGANARGVLISHIAAYYNMQINKKNVFDFSSIRRVKSKQGKKLLFFIDIDLEYDYFIDRILLSKLKNIKVVLFSPFYNKKMLQYVDIFVPIATSYETDGSFINIAGTLQKFKSVLLPLFKSKNLWQLLSVFGKILSNSSCYYRGIDDIYNEMSQASRKYYSFNDTKSVNFILKNKCSTFNITPMISMYKLDSLTRGATCLSNTKDFQWYSSVRISKDIAFKYFGDHKLPILLQYSKYNGSVLLLPDATLAFNTIMIPFEKFKDSRCIIRGIVLFNKCI